MTIFQAIFLAIVQGITEFLPVSSSGHLVLFQKLFHFSEAPILFDVLLHLGTLGAVFIFFYSDIKDLIINWRENKKIWLLLAVGSIPAAIFGFIFKSKIESAFNSMMAVSIAWILFGILLVSIKWLKREREKVKNQLDKLSFSDAVVIGLFQAAALFPGISRSGSTIVGGLFRKLSRETAFKFSFLLSIPAIFGAAVLEIRHANLGNISIGLAVFSMIIAGIVGYFALIFLQKVLKSEKFYYFGFYCLLIGILTLAFFK